MMLIQEIIHFEIHSLHNMITNVIFWIWDGLLAVEFDVLVEVPCQDGINTFVMIHCNHLQVVLLGCFNHLDDFNIWTEVHIHVMQNLFVFNLKHEIHYIGLALLGLFLVLNKSSIFNVLTAVDDDKIIIVDFGVDNVRDSSFNQGKVIDKVFVLGVIMERFWKPGLDLAKLGNLSIILFLLVLQDLPEILLSISGEFKHVLE